MSPRQAEARGIGSEEIPPLSSSRLLRRTVAVVAPLLGLALLVYIIIFPVGYAIRQSFGDSGFTLQGYRQLPDLVDFGKVIPTTLIVSLTAVTVAVVLGSLGAWLIERTDMPGRRFLAYVPMLPLLMSPVIVAIGFVYLLDPRAGYLNALIRRVTGLGGADEGPINIYSTPMVGLLIGLYSASYVFPIVRAALVSIDGSFEEAARVSGSGRLRTLVFVTLPLVRPAMLAGGLLALVVAVAEFSIPSILGTRANVDVVSTEIYRLAKGYPVNAASATALSSGVIAVCLLALIPVYVSLGRTYRFEAVGSRGHSSRVKLGRLRWPAHVMMLVWMFVICVGPLVAVALAAFTKFWQPHLATEDFTFAHMSSILHDSDIWLSIKNSITYSLVASFVAVVLAFGVAYYRRYGAKKLARVADFIAVLPLGVPGIIFGVGFLVLFIRGPISLYGTGAALVLAYIAKFIPMAVRTLTGAVVQVRSELVEAGRVSGARQGRAVMTIVVPLVAPAIFASWSLMSIVMLREFPASALLYKSETRVMSVELFTLLDSSVSGQVASFALIVFVVGLLMMALLGVALSPLWRWATKAKR